MIFLSKGDCVWKRRKKKERACGLSETEGYCIFCQKIRDRCHECHGTGAVRLSFDRFDYGTLGTQLGIGILETAGAYAQEATGFAMAVAIGYALKCPPLVLFSLAAVGGAANTLGGAGGPLAVLIVSVVAGECGKAVSKETKVDIIVTPFVTIFVGVVVAVLTAPAVGAAASWVGSLIMWATELSLSLWE